MASAKLKERRKEPRTTPWSTEVDPRFCVAIPAGCHTLSGFRRWTHSDVFPEHGNIAYLGGEIRIDMSPERYYTHNAPKLEISRVLSNLVFEQDLGRIFCDGVRIVHKAAELSNEPDALFVTWETFASGRVREVPTKDKKDIVEMVGTPNWVLEVVSPSSEDKDTVQLRDRYYRAEIPEYWLVDAGTDEVSFQILQYTEKDYRPASARGGWFRSKVFAHQFRLDRLKDRNGKDAFRLEMK